MSSGQSSSQPSFRLFMKLSGCDGKSGTMNPAGHLRRPPTDRATYTVAFLFEDRDMKQSLKFWRPESGALGGIVMGFALFLAVMIFLPPVIALSKWWMSVFGL